MSFGSALPDQFAQISSAVAANIALAQDLAGIFLQERSALEREYSQKLQSLVKKSKAARDKRLVESIAGPDPSKAWSAEGVRKSTLHSFLNSLFTSTDNIATQHSQTADQLAALSTELSSSAKRKEQNRKRQTEAAQQLISEREDVYAARIKAKSRYDELCGEVETARQKREKAAADDRHADRAAKQFEQAEVDMFNGKNAYLIAIAKANASKTKFYRRDQPAAQDALQRLWSINTSRLVTTITKALQSMRQHAESVQGQLGQAIDKAASVKAADDTALFIEYNHRRFVEPSDWTFEPCQGFFDTSEMHVDGSPRTVLQNVLIRDRRKVAEVDTTLESKRRETVSLDELCGAYQSNESLGNVDDVMDNLVESRKQLMSLESTRTLLQAEIDEITRAIGDDEGAARPHRFKHQAFAVPTTCNLCNGTIWGLSKQGSVCKACGYTAHIKCEIKVPADCQSAAAPTSSSSSSSATISRASSTASTHTRTLSASSTAGTVSSRMTMSQAFAHGATTLKARLQYDFDPTSVFELRVRAGEVVEVVEEDEDGSGWIKVRRRTAAKSGTGGATEQGLVPTSYVQFLAPGEEMEDEDEELPDLGELDADAIEGGGTVKGRSASLASASLAQASSPILGQAAGPAGRVRALYDFPGGGGSDELPLRAGDVVELTPTGYDYAEGWCEGTLGARTGIFPSSYVERI